MTRLSNRQYPMLEAFAHQKDDYRMSIEEAMYYDQRPFRSMLVRQWVTYKRGEGFRITRAGRDAWHEFHKTSIGRKNIHAPLTAYFDPTVYHLKAKKAAVA
jgi:hypothetical protein